MGFEDMPVAGKYALIGGIALLATLSLILGRYFWMRRRKQQKAFKESNKNIEEQVIEKKEDTPNTLPSLPRASQYPTLPRASQFPISGPVTRAADDDHKEEYSRTISLMPDRPKSSRPHPSELVPKARPHPSRGRQGSVHSEFSVVPTEFNLAQKSPGLAPPGNTRHRRKDSDDLSVADSYLPVPTSSNPQPRSITPPSPSVYSPGIEKPHEQIAHSKIVPTTITSPLTSPPLTSPNDDLYIRVPRLYEPPSLAYGAADLPYSPPRRNKLHYQPAGSLRRKRSVSMQDPATILRMNSNASATSLRRKGSRRGAAGDRQSTQSEWVDTLTVIDDGHEGTAPSTPGLEKSMLSPIRPNLIMPRRSSKGSVRKNRASKQIPKSKLSQTPTSSNTSWNNNIIAEQMAAIKYSTKRNRSKSPPKSGKKDEETKEV